MQLVSLFAALAVLAASPSPAAAASPWRVAASLPLVFDVGGPRPDGSLVVQTGDGLALLNPATGAIQPFASVYKGTGQFESYIAVVPPHGAAACFNAGDVYAIEQTPHGGVAKIAADGTQTPLAAVPNVDTLGGITFDTSGDFDGRLLVTGPHQGRITVAAIDCTGAVTTITTSAPVVEGGLTVAPKTFGAYGGDLIAPDELSGKVYAIAPTGTAQLIAQPDLAHGGDIGVEGAGFVPAADVSGDTALFADRVTPGSPHPGNDYLLAAGGSLLKAAGARPGDLLLATEGGAALVAVRCAGASCSVLPIIAADATSHGEGHLLVLSAATSSHPAGSSINRTPANTETPLVVGLVAGLALVLVLLVAVRRRQGGYTPPP